MTEQNDSNSIDRGGIAIAGLMIVVGAVAIWQTLDMSDSDSFVFPRAVAGAMILLSLVYILRQLVRPGAGSNDEAGLVGGSNLRRSGLMVVMVGGSLAMPWTGFMISGIIVFAAIMLLAMYDEWTPRRRWLFPLVGLVVVVGFYLLFAELLSVPLPTGVLFD